VTPTISVTPTPTITFTRTPTLTPTKSPTRTLPFRNSYDVSKCSDGTTSTWITDSSLTVGGVYTLSDPTGVPNNSLECYTITSTTTTTSPANIGTVYNVADCNANACIKI
jgi:hypothetical protein